MKDSETKCKNGHALIGHEECTECDKATPPETSSWEEEFDKKFKCIQGDCDGAWSIPYMVDDYEGGHWEAQQCQFHAEYLFPLKDFIRSVASSEYKRGVEFGRVSVLKDFDTVCKVDAFIGFTDAEFSAVKKFFEFNKQISNWDK